MNGRVHSLQSLGASDGPGLRYVIFMQGCPNRCAYCHNPDTIPCSGGTEYSSGELVKKALRFKSYFGNNGGVTVSGGEPLLQGEFTAELFARLQNEGIHTALDTSGAGDLRVAEKLLAHTSLVLCDIKFPDEESCFRFCGISLERVKEFLALTEKMSVPLVVRHVVVPTLTDGNESVLRVAELAKSYDNLVKTELLPFRKLCVSKYEALGIPFPLASLPECDSETVERLRKLL